MKATTGYSIALCISLTLSACTTIRTGSECTMDEALVREFTTYAWLPTEPIVTRGNQELVTQEVVHRIQSEIELGFMEAGYQLIDDPDLADFVIAGSLTLRQQKQGKVYFPVISTDFVDHIKPGDVHLEVQTLAALALDAYDGASGLPFWRAWAERPLNISDRQLPRKPVRQAVTTIIAQFPHR